VTSSTPTPPKSRIAGPICPNARRRGVPRPARPGGRLQLGECGGATLVFGFRKAANSGPVALKRVHARLRRAKSAFTRVFDAFWKRSSFLFGIYFVFTRIVNHCLTLWASSRRTLAPTGRRNSGSARRIWLKLMRGDNQSLAKKTVWGNILWRFAGPGPGCSCKPAPQFVNQPLVTLARVGLSPSVVSPSVVSPGIVMGRPYGVPTSCPKRRGKGQCAFC